MYYSRRGQSFARATRQLANLVTMLVTAAILILVGGGMTPANATTGSGKVMPTTTQQMTAPSLKSTQVGTYRKNQVLSLTCYVRGQSVTGYFGGPDNIWYKVSDGRYVADIDLETGSNNPITSKCSKTEMATGWAWGQLGSESYYNLCERFVENAYGTSGRYASALSAYNAMRAAGAIHTSSTNIPAGALVFSDGPVDGPNGHVMLSIGGGTFISGGANGPSVKVFTTPNPGSTYLGWSYAPTSWPGR